MDTNALLSWIRERDGEVEAETKMVADVRLFASDWEVRDLSGVDKDTIDPRYAGQSDRVKAMKKKWYWPLVNPVYRLYANVKVRTILFSRMDKKTVAVKLKNKIEVKWKNRPSVVRRRNRAFLQRIALSPEEAEAQRGYRFRAPVTISVIVPLYNTPEPFLRAMIESVTAQTYEKWELCLGDGSDQDHPEVGRIVQEYAEKDGRIRYRRLERNEGISGNTNATLELASGEYVALFDHDDLLHPSALFWCMKEIEERGAEFIYTDEMTFEEKVERIVTLHFKPGYSPVTLNGVNYICHLSVFKKALLEENGLYNDAYDGSQDHDMILRLTTAASHVSHVPKVLYFWRVHPGSVSENIEAKPYAVDAGRRAVRDNEERLGRDVEVHSSCICATHYRLRYLEPRLPEVRIIVTHYQAEQSLARLLSSIEVRTEEGGGTVVVADLGSEQTPEIPGILTEKRRPEETIAAFLDRLVRDAQEEYILFLDAHMEIVDGFYLPRLLGYAMQAKIAATASRVTDRFGMLTEAGYLIGLGEDGVALPIEHGNNYSAPGYMGRMYYAHNLSAASAFGMMVRRNRFLALGGFAPQITSPRYLGIEWSLKCRAAGYQVVMNPYVIHISDDPLAAGFSGAPGSDAAYLLESYGSLLAAGDPYYNPNLARDGSFTVEMVTRDE